MSLLMLGAIAWSATLVWFVDTMPRDAVPATQTSDALVVLTGGKDRVEHGLAMLAQGAAPVLFISGVGEHVTEEQILLEHASAELRENIYAGNREIILDHVARSTVSNADQAAEFIRARGITSIRLITANYHMKRSLREFHSAIPGLVVIADPVSPEGFRRDEWWAHDNTRRLVFTEFYKYLAVLLRDALRPN